MLLNKNIKLIINYLFGPIVFVLLVFAIYKQLYAKNNWIESMQQIQSALRGPQQWKIGLVFVLMLLNWGIEAKKWQLSIAPVQHMTWWRSFKATLTGSTMASLTPNRMGEYLGRMLYIEKGKRAQSISLSILCSISQIIVTLATGCVGIFYLLWHLHHNEILHVEMLHLWLNVLLVIVILLLLIATVVYFRLSWVVGLMRALRLPEKYLVYVKVLQEVDESILLRILFLSFLRYCVFILQYHLIFSVFDVSLTLSQTFGSISVVFLIMAIVPTFTFLTELGLRWEASIQLVELYSANTIGIFAGSIGIWLINLAIPALTGSLLILGIKLFKNK